MEGSLPRQSSRLHSNRIACVGRGQRTNWKPAEHVLGGFTIGAPKHHRYCCTAIRRSVAFTSRPNLNLRPGVNSDVQTSWPVVVVRNPGGVRRHGGKGISILHRLVVDPVLKLVNSNVLPAWLGPCGMVIGALPPCDKAGLLVVHV